jgi:hypothetical protein
MVLTQAVEIKLKALYIVSKFQTAPKREIITDTLLSEGPEEGK